MGRDYLISNKDTPVKFRHIFHVYAAPDHLVILIFNFAMYVNQDAEVPLYKLWIRKLAKKNGSDRRVIFKIRLSNQCANV